MDKEKKRSSNFTYAEKHFLLNLIADKYSKVLEDKKTARCSLQKRQQAWQQIEEEFNAKSPSNIFRDATTLSKFYSNKKKDIRKKVAGDKKEILLTGGGPPPKLLVNAEDDMDTILLSIMNEKTVHGLDNPYDCDADNTAIITTNANTSVEFEFIDGREHLNMTAMTESDPLTYPTYSTVEESIKKDATNIRNTDNETSTSWKTPSLLQKPINTALKVTPVNTVSGKSSKDNTAPDKSRRTPTQTIKSLSSSNVAEKYDILMDRRLTLIEKQIQQIDEERAHQQQKRKLEIEILKLDLETKKKNLHICGAQF